MNTKDFKTRSGTIHRAAPCPANHWIIGLDIGYSAIKGMFQLTQGKSLLIVSGSMNLLKQISIIKQKMVISGLLDLWLTMNFLHRT